MSRRLFYTLALIVLLSASAGAAYYARQEGFTQSWRKLVEQEFAKRGYHAEVDRLTLDPVRGLVARDLRFYADKDHEIRLASINEVLLDMDLSEVIDKKISLNTIALQDANLSLRLEPENPESPTLDIESFSARVIFGDQTIEIAEAEGRLQGVQVSVRGSLYRPVESPEDKKVREAKEKSEAKKSKKDSATSATDALTNPSFLSQSERELISRILTELDELEFLGDSIPELSIELQGDYKDLSAFRAEAKLVAGGIRRGNYEVNSMRVALDYTDRHFSLRDFQLRDAKGDLKLRADWNEGSDEASFTLVSSADLPALIQSIEKRPEFGEVVFFSAPRLAVEGIWKLNQPLELANLPFEMIGHFETDRLASRGEIFDALSADFRVSDSRFYVRNLMLNHRTGFAQAHALYDDEGFRYQAELKLDPKAFAAFFPTEGAQRFFQRLSFDKESTVYVAAAGSGAELSPKTWTHEGSLDLRDFRLNGAQVDRLELGFELSQDKVVANQIELAQGEGSLAVEQILILPQIKSYELFGLTSTLDLVEGTRVFNPKLAEKLKRYQFSAPPTVTLAGVVDGRKRDVIGDAVRFSDLEIKFESDAPAVYAFLGEPLDLQRPKGVLKLKGNGVHLHDLEADIYGGKLRLDFQSLDLRNTKDFTTSIVLEDVDYGALAEIYHAKNKTQGTFAAAAQLDGTLGELDSLGGTIRCTLQDGDIFAVPIFGPLSRLIEDVMSKERAGYSVARDAQADFRLENGIMRTENFEAKTEGFLFKANGDIDLVKQTLDMNTTFNTKFGLTRFLLSPVSKLLEYRGEGPISAPEWRPRLLSRLPRGKKP